MLTNRKIPAVLIGGIRTDVIDMAGLTDLLVADLGRNIRSQSVAKTMFDINGHGISLAASDNSYRDALRSADIVHADGEPVVVASRLIRGGGIPERTATTDFIHSIAQASQEHGIRLYLLGAAPDVVNRAHEALLRSYPGAKIVGFRDGYFSEKDEAAVCEEINGSGADVVVVAMGKPREQSFCIRNREILKVAWLITAGGCFDFLANEVRRAPRWMQSAGLEWSFRLAQEPGRLWRRYLFTNIHASWLILTRTDWANKSSS